MITSPQKITILPSSQSSPGSVKNSANDLIYAGNQIKDPLSRSLFASIAKSLQNVQSQLDSLFSALQGSISLPNPIQITDDKGNLVGVIGNFVSNNQSFQPAWFATLYLGSSGPDSGIALTIVSGVLTVPGDVNAAGFQVSGVPGLTGAVTIPKLTSGGSNGAIVFAGGIATSALNPT